MYYGLLATELETSGSMSHVEVKALRLTAQPPPFSTIRQLSGTLKGHLKQGHHQQKVHKWGKCGSNRLHKRRVPSMRAEGTCLLRKVYVSADCHTSARGVHTGQLCHSYSGCRSAPSTGPAVIDVSKKRKAREQSRLVMRTVLSFPGVPSSSSFLCHGHQPVRWPPVTPISWSSFPGQWPW